MSTNKLFLYYLFDTTLISKEYKNDIIANIIKNNSKEIIDLVNSSKFNKEIPSINKAKNLELYNKFTDKFEKLNQINTDLGNECGDYETGDIDRVISEMVSICKEPYINYTNQDGETILFYLLREYYDKYESQSSYIDGGYYSLMDIFDAIILNKNFDIDIKNNKGIDAYNLCKDLGDYDDSDSEEEFDEKDYNKIDVICKMSYRRKLNKKHI